MPRRLIPIPDWYDKPHTEWPPGALIFYDLLLEAARRRLAAEEEAAARTLAEEKEAGDRTLEISPDE